MNRSGRRLEIRRETLRRLAAGELGQVAGGRVGLCTYERSGCAGGPSGLCGPPAFDSSACDSCKCL